MSFFFFGRLTDWVLRRRGAVAVLIVLLTAFFLWKMQDLQFDNSNEIWFSEGDPSLERINTFHKLFGNDDFVYLVFDADTLFSPESLRLLSDLVSDIRKKVPYLRDVTWLGNAERIEADAEGIVVSDFIDPETYDAASMPELRRRALAEKNYRDNLISSDGKTVGMLLEMRTYPRDSVEPRSEVTHALRGVLAQPEYAGFSIHAVGQPILHNDYNELSFKESATFFGLCLLVQMVLLFWLGKGVRGVIGPISVVVLSVIWTLGMIQVLGFTLNLFIILIPTLLICVCIGDSMHIIATYNQHRREGLGVVAALRQAMSETGMPCLLTSLTTADSSVSARRISSRSGKWASTRPWARSWPISSVSSSCCSFTVLRGIRRRPRPLRGCPVRPPVLLPRQRRSGSERRTSSTVSSAGST